MGTVKFLDPVDYVSGKVSKKNSRTIYKRLRSTDYRFTSVREESEKNKSSAAQQEHRTKFSSVVRATRQRLQNATKIAQDQAAFLAQKQYPTLYGYVFGQEWKAYNA